MEKSLGLSDLAGLQLVCSVEQSSNWWLEQAQGHLYLCWATALRSDLATVLCLLLLAQVLSHFQQARKSHFPNLGRGPKLGG